MKTNAYLLIVITGLFFAGCVPDTIEGPPGRDGQNGQNGRDGVNGNANVYYSDWISPTQWAGKTGDWYFDVNDPAITENIVEQGAILAYVSVPGDLYDLAVRPMPAYAIGANWEYIIPGPGTIEFLSDAIDLPGTVDYSFRYVLIPSNIRLKSASIDNVSIETLKSMTYKEVCAKFDIPE